MTHAVVLELSSEMGPATGRAPIHAARQGWQYPKPFGAPVI